jgi:5-formyltetrahydrofolate cyclo-ligase
MMSKGDLRAAARAERGRFSRETPDYAAAVARFAVDIALDCDVIVGSYWPIGSEADPRMLARALAARGHGIVLPCVVEVARALVFRPWREGEPLQTNIHGALEPLADKPQHVPAAILVPLLAFDKGGFRLGYGGGYYDRTLAGLRARGHVLAIGIAYGGQETESLPREPHDQPLDMIVTEKGVRRFGK